MATLGKRIDPEEEEETLEQLEGFDDFTLASSWERFISDIEAVCRLWMVDGPKNLVYKGAEQLSFPKRLYKVKSELKYGSKNYCLEYYFEVDSHGKFVEWDDDLHNLQVLFGIKEFLVIAPISVSKVILDAPEASKLLSSVAIALSNCGSVWPALVPVHDPSRKAYIGIQNMGMIFTRRFETDRIGSQVPIRLMHLEGLYELFVSKFALSLTDISARILNVHFTMKLTYRTPLYDDGDDMQGTETPEENTVAEPHLRAQWDEDCSWSEWYSAEDPVRGFELIAVWSRKTVGSSFEMAEIENASSIDAEKWIMFPVLSSYMMDDASGNPVGFASQLDLLVKAFDICFDVKFMEDFLSAENSGPGNSKPANSIPSPTVVDRVIKDLFHDGVQIPNNPKREHSNSRAVKGAPLESLFAQFCLYALWFGDCNIRAIAVLWIEFVREVRWCWEESQTLPRVVTDGGIDLSTCIIHQKLQMLAICIERKNMKQNYTESRDHTPDAKDKYHDEVSQFQSHHYKEKQGKRYDSGSKKAMRSEIERADTSASAESEHVDCVRRGSPGIESSMMLLRSYKYMNAPLTQEDPIMTEDMHEERLRAIEAFGDSSSFSGQLEKDILSSDMSAFKAANSDAIFEDFIRWHSPGDWEDEQFEANNKSSANEVGGSKVNWPPRGKLSQRMSERGNSWRQIWNDSPPLPASMQKPLLDPIREGEKIVHYLETLKPDQLLAQMICASFKASLDTLNQTSYGNLKQMKTKIGQLYLTIASTLKHFKGSNMPDKTEFVGDLRRLCIVFGHVEKLLFLAASIHRKLSDAPRLAEAIFNDCFTFYLPKFGTGSENICYDKKFDSKQQVRIKERDAVERLFPPPTANQSWRKVLSMGNLLNGHEPVLREIIFSVHDKVGSGRYGANASQGSADEEEIETHRMYICGTSNDLQVALSVISWD